MKFRIVTCIICCVRRKWYVKFKRTHVQAIPIYNPVVTTHQSIYPPVNSNDPDKQQNPYNPYPAAMVYDPQTNQPYPPSVMMPPQAGYQPNIQINHYTFMNEVKLVTLDEDNRYLGQEICLFCSKKFTQEVETRILPCQHAYHGKCAYEVIALGNSKFCPVCKTRYV